jgi:competence protein ComEC
MTSVSIAAQITTLPLTIYYFHNIPVLSLISNLFIIPLSTLLIYSSSIFLSLSYFPNNHFIILITNKLSYALTSVIKYFSDISFAVVEHINISIFQVILLYLIILIIKYFLESKKPVCVIWILSLIILFLGNDIIRLLFL